MIYRIILSLILAIAYASAQTPAAAVKVNPNTNVLVSPTASQFYNANPYSGTVSGSQITGTISQSVLTNSGAVTTSTSQTISGDKTFSGAVKVTGTLAGGLYATNSIWVDAALGNNSTAARGVRNLPFATLEAAMQAAQEGDTVYVAQGVYLWTSTASLLWKNRMSLIGSGKPTLDNWTSPTQLIGGTIIYPFLTNRVPSPITDLTISNLGVDGGLVRGVGVDTFGFTDTPGDPGSGTWGDRRNLFEKIFVLGIGTATNSANPSRTVHVFNLESTADLVVKDCTIYGGWHGLVMKPLNARVDGFQAIDSLEGLGLYSGELNRAHAVNISNCYFDRCGTGLYAGFVSTTTASQTTDSVAVWGVNISNITSNYCSTGISVSPSGTSTSSVYVTLANASAYNCIYGFKLVSDSSYSSIVASNLNAISTTTRSGADGSDAFRFSGNVAAENIYAEGHNVAFTCLSVAEKWPAILNARAINCTNTWWFMGLGGEDMLPFMLRQPVSTQNCGGVLYQDSNMFVWPKILTLFTYDQQGWPTCTNTVSAANLIPRAGLRYGSQYIPKSLLSTVGNSIRFKFAGSLTSNAASTCTLSLNVGSTTIWTSTFSPTATQTFSGEVVLDRKSTIWGVGFKSTGTFTASGSAAATYTATPSVTNTTAQKITFNAQWSTATTSNGIWLTNMDVTGEGVLTNLNE